MAPVIRGLAVMCLLAGCGAPALAPSGAPQTLRAEPRTAILYQNTVTVEFTDGSLCVAKRPGTARAWAGQLVGCPHLRPFQVTLPQGQLAPRRVLVRLADGGVRVISVDEAAFGLNAPAS